MPLGKVAIVGVGLIGGSFALALKAARACAEVVGVGRDPANVALALERGAIDRVARDPAQAVRGAELVLVATPVGQLQEIFAAMREALEPSCLVTDAGSTKRDVIAAARAGLGAKIARFVPAHPIAGAEQSGIAAASAELFRDRRVVIAPLAENSPEAIERVSEAWRTCGARLTRMAPEEHDAVLGAVSHLPHLLAFALVHEVAARDNAAQLFAYAASGFRDFTRIASSHPEMWRDICMANRDHLLAELKRFGKALAGVERRLACSDAAGLEKLFAEAREARGRWLDGEFDA
jgi:prephenate dehydrogenase